MIGILPRLGEIPHRGLFAIRIPSVRAVFLPPIQHWFVLPLVWGTAKYEGVFDPNTTARQVEASVLKSATEVQSFGVGVEDIG